MKISIITPTHKRVDSLKRAVESVLSQTYHNWEMIIINDSPSDDSYINFASSINDQRIRYYMNDRNRGMNFTRNVGLDHLSADSKWVLFLDDDDYLAPDALKHFFDTILLEQTQKWLMSNRALKNGKPLTRGAVDGKTFSYVWSYLIFKKVKGDATHCIETKLIDENKVRFLKNVKQGEEWYFFYQIALITDPYYVDHNSTITDGYDVELGQNFRKRPLGEYYKSLFVLFYSLYIEEKITTPVCVYGILRLLRPLAVIFKK